MGNKCPIVFRISDDEARLLRDYAKATGRTQSDVVREFIRLLKARLARLAGRGRADDLDRTTTGPRESD